MSGTATDTDTQTWNNGTWTATFTPSSSHPNLGDYNINGVPLNPTKLVWSGALSAGGAFSQAMYDNNLVSPAGSTWVFQMCPNAGGACWNTTPLVVTGASQNISSTIGTIPPPRFSAVAAAPYAYGYIDAEVTPGSPKPGGMYFNVTSSRMRLWNGTAWADVGSGGGGGGTPAGLNQAIQKNVGGAFATSNILAADNGSTLQSTVTAAGTTHNVFIPQVYTGSDSFTNPNGIQIPDYRTSVPMYPRSVKEFGAQCYGAYKVDGSLATGSNIFTLTAPGTSSFMIGRYLVISGTDTGVVYPTVYMPTVTSVIDSTHLQLSSNSPFTVPATGNGNVPSVYLYQGDAVGMQAALDWCASHLCEVSFPAGSCFAEKHLIWSGQSMGGQGRVASQIVSAPADDIFLNPDPLSINPNTGLPYGSTTPLAQQSRVHDFKMLVDQSVTTTWLTGWNLKKRWFGQQSAWANNPTGACWAGMKLGAPIANGTDLTLTLNKTPTLNMPYFSCGFAQLGAVKIDNEVINYRGVSGSTVTLRIRGDQGTTATSHLVGADVVPVNPFLYTDTTDYLPAWQVGNGAIVIEQSNIFNQAQGGLFQDVFERLSVENIGNVPGNSPSSSVTFYSANPPYEAKFRDIKALNMPFGFIFTMPAVNTDVAITGQATMDNAVFEANNIHASIPFFANVGCCVKVTKDSYYNGPLFPPSYMGPVVDAHGPSITRMVTNNGTGGVASNLGGWTWDTLYDESNLGHDGVTNYAGPYAELGSSTNTMLNSSFGGGGYDNFLVSGDNNQGGSADVAHIYSTGLGNKLFTHATPYALVSQLGTQGVFQNPYSYRAENFPYQRPLFGNITADSLQAGTTDPTKLWSSNDDLFFGPEDLSSQLGGVASIAIGVNYYVDNTAPITHAYVQMPTQTIGAAWSPRVRGGSGGLVAGITMPMSTGNVYYAMKLDAPGTATLTVYQNCNGSNKTPKNLTLTTSWQIFYLPYDATAANCTAFGGSIQFIFLATTALPIIDFAWEAVVPNPSGIYTYPITLDFSLTSGVNPLTIKTVNSAQKSISFYNQSLGAEESYMTSNSYLGTGTNDLTWGNPGRGQIKTFNQGIQMLGSVFQMAAASRMTLGGYSPAGANSHNSISWSDTTWINAPSQGLVSFDLEGSSGIQNGNSGAAIAATSTYTNYLETAIPTNLAPPTISLIGTAGSTTYTYTCVGKDRLGNHTAVSPATSTVIGNATLNITNYNQIQCQPIPRVAQYDVYRTVGGATQGKIASDVVAETANAAFVTFKDQGATGDGTTAPATNNIPIGTALQEGSIQVPSRVGYTINWADSILHRPYFNPNAVGGLLYVGTASVGTAGNATKYAANGIDIIDSGGPPAVLLASNGVALTTSAVAANTCVTATPITVTGTATTSGITTTFNSNPTGVTGWGSVGGLVIRTWPTLNTINYAVCNQTASSITPGAISVNFRVF